MNEFIDVIAGLSPVEYHRRNSIKGKAKVDLAIVLRSKVALGGAWDAVL